jgi:hypothetical protein
MPTARHNISKRSSSTDESCLPKRFVDPTNRTIDLIWLPRMQTDAVGDLGFPEIIPLFLFYKSRVLGTNRERDLGVQTGLDCRKVRRIGTYCLDGEQP